MPSDATMTPQDEDWSLNAAPHREGLLVAVSKERPDAETVALNGLSVVAGMREAGGRNRSTRRTTCADGGQMDPQEIKEIIIKELPSILKDDPEMRELVLRMTEGRYADKELTESRFDRILDELRRHREAETERWNQLAQERAAERAEQARLWDNRAQERAEERAEQARLWAEDKSRWEENSRRWDRLAQERAEERAEQARLWAEDKSRWEENSRRWDRLAQERAAEREEQARRWEENHKAIRGILDSVNALARKHEMSIGALGARWGIRSESSFRNGLRGILEDDFGVEVVHVREIDEDGEVFGRRDQIELDIIIRNGKLIICEIKSSMSRSDVHMFERKARYYERRHNRTATRLIVISPMVDPRAQPLADELGITVYSHPLDIEKSALGEEESE
ncbi:MAG: DUF3782 domain-containing protein [Thermodesulfobacteriota bacterium]